MELQVLASGKDYKTNYFIDGNSEESIEESFCLRGWRHCPSGRVPASQEQGTEFNPEYHQK
jgi:hypothetical protein